MKIPYPGDLNPIELAVWAAEYVRVRATHLRANGLVPRKDIERAIEEANFAIDDLRHVQELA